MLDVVRQYRHEDHLGVCFYRLSKRRLIEKQEKVMWESFIVIIDSNPVMSPGSHR